MARIIEQLAYKITGDTGQFDKSIDGTDKKTTGLTGKLGSLGKLLTVGAVAVGIVAVGKKLFNMATDAAAAGDRVDKMSQKIGISRDAFQEWDFILSQSGASVDGLQMSVKTLSNAASEARDGTAEYKDEFDRLGISVTDTNGKMKTQEGLLNEVFAALSNMEDETQRTATASKLLGRSATELAPAMNQGADSIEAMRQKSHELGLVLKDELIDEAVKFTDNMDQLRRKGKALLTEAIAPLLTPMNSFMGYLIDGNDPTRKLAEAIDILKSASAEYQIVTKKLNGDLKGITASEKTRLELRQVESLLEIRNAVKDLSGSYGELKQEEEDLTNERVLLTAKSTLATNVLSGYTEEQKASALAHGKQVIAIRDNMWFMELQGQATRGSTDAFIKENEATIRIMDAYNLFNDSQDKLITNDERIFEIKSKTNPVIQTAAELVKAEMLNIDNLLVSDIELYNAIMNLVGAKEEEIIVTEDSTVANKEYVTSLDKVTTSYDKVTGKYYASGKVLEDLTQDQIALANETSLYSGILGTSSSGLLGQFNVLGTVLPELTQHQIDLANGVFDARINLEKLNPKAAEYVISLNEMGDILPALTQEQINFANSVFHTDEKFKGLVNTTGDSTDAFKEWEQIVGDGIGSFTRGFEDVGQAIYDGAGAWETLQIASMKAFASILSGLGAELAARAVVSALALDFVGAGLAIAGSAAAYTASGLVSASAGSINIPPATNENSSRYVEPDKSTDSRSISGDVVLQVDGEAIGRIALSKINSGRVGVVEQRVVK